MPGNRRAIPSQSRIDVGRRSGVRHECGDGRVFYSVILSYPPGVNRIWRNVRGRVVASSEAELWKRDAAAAAKLAGMRKIEGDVSVSLVLHPRMTLKGVASKVRLDVDAPIKLALDALQGVAYADDKQVVRVTAEIGQPMFGGGLTLSIAGLEGG